MFIKTYHRQIRWFMAGIVAILAGSFLLPTPNVEAQEALSENYVSDQIIITGPAAEVKAAVAIIERNMGISRSSQGVVLQLDSSLDLSWIPQDQWLCQQTNRSTSYPTNYTAEESTLVMSKYRVVQSDPTPGADTQDMVPEILALPGNVNVSVSPNYITGDQYGYFGSGINSTVQAPADAFWKQWALFGPEGIGLSMGSGRQSDILYTGEGVTVAIFDTSPFAEAGPIQIDDANLSMALTVSIPEGFDEPSAPAAMDFSDHGLAVAGLVHAVAPDADIHLIQVLQDNLMGDLFTLNSALNAFIHEQDSQAPTVINLSLGIPFGDEPPRIGCNDELASLRTLLSAARNLKNMTIIGSAGNDTAALPQIPAIWPEVIALSASGTDHTLAAYANKVDGFTNYENLTAPGGAAVNCQEEGESCLIGPAIHSETGYGYWIGTSFAAPLASGLAALFLEQNIEEGAAPDPDIVAANLAQSVAPETSGDGRGTGVLDLQCGSYAGDLLRSGVCHCDIEIDNDGAYGDGRSVTFKGNWKGSNVVPGFMGTSYQHDKNGRKGKKWVTFTPNLATDGLYELFARWTAHPNRATNIPMDIHYNGGSETVVVDQQHNGDGWNSLGLYEFRAGTEGAITIRTDETNGYVIADAVRFVAQSCTSVAVDLYAPTTVGTTQSQVVLPISALHDLTTHALLAYQFSLDYDPSVLSFVGVSKAETRSAAWDILSNTTVPGRLNIAALGTSPLTGKGDLLHLRFDVIGAPGDKTALQFGHFMVNEGTPRAAAHDGRFGVISTPTIGIAGSVIYGDSGDTPVPSTRLHLSGTTAVDVMSNSQGLYEIGLEESGDYTVVPIKQGDEQGAISPLDAAQILQCVVGLIDSRRCPVESSDLSGDGQVTALDGAYIASHLLGLTEQAGMAGSWHFSAAQRSYLSLNEYTTEPPYSAYLRGDVTGNWTTEGSRSRELIDNRAPVMLKAASASIDKATRLVTIPVEIANLTELKALGYQLTVQFDPKQLQFQHISKEGSVSAGWSVAHRSDELGTIEVVGYGVQPLAEDGTLLHFTFEQVGERLTPTTFTLNAARINEGEPTVYLVNHSLYLPLLHR